MRTNGCDAFAQIVKELVDNAVDACGSGTSSRFHYSMAETILDEDAKLKRVRVTINRVKNDATVEGSNSAWIRIEIGLFALEESFWRRRMERKRVAPQLTFFYRSVTHVLVAIYAYSSRLRISFSIFTCILSLSYNNWIKLLFEREAKR